MSHHVQLLTPIFTLAVAFQTSLFSQKAPMKFGEIPKEDLEMKQYALDTTAEAIVLGEYCSVSFEFQKDEHPWLNRQIHRRIKILKRSAFSRGDIKIPYYSGNNEGSLKNMKVEIHAPDGQVARLSKSEIFEEKVTKGYTQVRFSCPNLQEGAVIDYQYEISSRHIFQIPTWYFQEDIPTRWSELRVEIPQFYDYVFLKQGLKPEIEEITTGNESYRLPISVSSGSDVFTAKTLNLRLAHKDVPAMKEEPYITTMDDYLTSVRFQLSVIQYPNSPPQKIITDWTMLALEIMNDEDFGKRFTIKKNYGKIWDDAKLLLEGASAQMEKAKLLYEFVNKNFTLDEGSGIFAESRFNDCYEKHTAKKKEMNLIMLGLLKEAGIEAYPLLISQRDNGRAMTTYPFLQQFDHIMIMANIDNNNTIIDLGNRYRPIGYPGINTLNYEALLIQEGASEWVDIIPSNASDTWLVNAKLDEEGNLNGLFKYSCEGYSASIEREACDEKPNGKHLKDKILQMNPDASLDSILIDGKDDLYKPLKMAFKANLPNSATISGDLIYFTPISFSNFTENPFKDEKRNYAVDLPYPIKEQMILNLELPNGYSLEDSPKPIKVSTPNGNCKFSYQMSGTGSKLQIVANLQINQLRFLPEEYSGLRDFFSYVEEKLGSQIVLKHQ